MLRAALGGGGRRALRAASGLATATAPQRRFLSGAAGGRDPYATLGVSRTASANEIKSKYRELAKKYHPDLNPGADSSAKMAAVSAAYQILSDPKQREFFDRTGVTASEAGVDDPAAAAAHAAGGMGGASFDPSMMFTDFASFFADAFEAAQRGKGGVHRGGAPGARRGDDVVTEVTLEFLEAAAGCTKTVTLQLQSACGDCGGSGCAPGTTLAACRHCGGTGTLRLERGPIVFGTPCHACAGSGQVVAKPCRSCRGSGRRPRTRAVDLQFPPGVRNGMELRIAGQGDCGSRSGGAGDLHVKINVLAHPLFSLAPGGGGDDVTVTVPLTLRQCLLGGTVAVPTLDGTTELTLPRGTSPGETRTLRGKGLKRLRERGFGDLKIRWELRLPQKLTPRQQEIIEEFDRIQFGRPAPPAAQPAQPAAAQPAAAAAAAAAAASTAGAPTAGAPTAGAPRSPSPSGKYRNADTDRADKARPGPPPPPFAQRPRKAPAAPATSPPPPEPSPASDAPRPPSEKAASSKSGGGSRFASWFGGKRGATADGAASGGADAEAEASC